MIDDVVDRQLANVGFGLNPPGGNGGNAFPGGSAMTNVGASADTLIGMNEKRSAFCSRLQFRVCHGALVLARGLCATVDQTLESFLGPCQGLSEVVGDPADPGLRQSSQRCPGTRRHRDSLRGLLGLHSLRPVRWLTRPTTDLRPRGFEGSPFPSADELPRCDVV